MGRLKASIPISIGLDRRIFIVVVEWQWAAVGIWLGMVVDGSGVGVSFEDR